MATEADIQAGVARLVERFRQTTVATDHFAIVGDPRRRAQIMWIRTNRRELWAELRPAIMESWDRVYPESRLLKEAAANSADLMRQGRLL